MTHQQPVLPKILRHLQNLGLNSEILEKIGAFGVSWGIFESNLETILWLMDGEDVKGNRPSTDKSTITEWIKRLEQGHASLSKTENEIIAKSAKAASDLIHYRHSLFHGTMVPLPGGAPLFIRNPLWNGEIRKRKSTSASVSDNLLDMSIEITWSLILLLVALRQAIDKSVKVRDIEGHKKSIDRARSMASELRHLATCGSHEKY